MPIGNRIAACRHRIPADLLEQYRGLPTANISDSLSRMFAGGPDLRPMHGGGQLLGQALTVRTRPGDNLLVHQAIEMAEPGDVIVVDAGGDLTNAIIGELMVAYAGARGVAGMVINGAIRDLAAIRAGAFPVFACGVTHRGPFKDGPGEINMEISLDGMIVRPGDLIVGDADGVVGVPFADAAEVARLARARNAAEDEALRAILAGGGRKDWIPDAIRRAGCEFVAEGAGA